MSQNIRRRTRDGAMLIRLLILGALAFPFFMTTDIHGQVTTRRSARTLTNKELEPTRRERENRERDAASAAPRSKLPSEEQMRANRERDELFLREVAAQEAAEQKGAEAYWRARASALRTEIASLDAQLNFLRTRLAEISTPVSTPYAVTIGAPYFYGRRRYYSVAPPPAVNPFLTSIQPAFNVAPANPGLAAAPQQFSGSVAIGRGAIRGTVGVNSQSYYGRTTGRTGIYVAPPFLYNQPYGNYQFGYEREALALRYNELQTVRAGLLARWRSLEDEARQAGAPPGWLR